jgi:hypothetical protein
LACGSILERKDEQLLVKWLKIDPKVWLEVSKFNNIVYLAPRLKDPQDQKLLWARCFLFDGAKSLGFPLITREFPIWDLGFE